MTAVIDTADTVNAIIARYPATVSVFNTFGIDACCGGDASVEEAARRDGVNVQLLVEKLQAFMTRDGDTG